MVKAVTYLLLFVHGILAIWALVGFIEWFWTEPPWPRVSNELFPRDILFMQWALTLMAGSVFVSGYVFEWSYTPVALASVYLAMAALCAVETFNYMQSDSRFVAMALEYFAYVGILLFLFRYRVFQSASR